MSRAFVREEDGDLPEDLPELPISLHPNYVTPTGLALLEQELTDVLRTLSQLDSGQLDFRQQTALLERRVRWLRARIGAAILVPVGAGESPETVAFGHFVALMDENDNASVVQIVGEDESEPAANKVSWRSPLAQALLGANIGEEVLWQRPVGDLLVEITGIFHQQPVLV